MISGMQLIPRAIEAVVRQRLQEQPAVVLLGPRQVGKTTLARQIAEERGEAAIYLDLERPADLRRLDDADAYLRRSRASWWSSTRSIVRPGCSPSCAASSMRTGGAGTGPGSSYCWGQRRSI